MLLCPEEGGSSFPRNVGKFRLHYWYISEDFFNSELFFLVDIQLPPLQYWKLTKLLSGMKTKRMQFPEEDKKLNVFWHFFHYKWIYKAVTWDVGWSAGCFNYVILSQKCYMDIYPIHSCYRYGLYCIVGNCREMKKFIKTAHQMVKPCMRFIYLVQKITCKQN